MNTNRRRACRPSLLCTPAPLPRAVRPPDAGVRWHAVPGAAEKKNKRKTQKELNMLRAVFFVQVPGAVERGGVTRARLECRC